MFLWIQEHIIKAWRNTNTTKTDEQKPLITSTEAKNTMSKPESLLINVISPEGKIRSLTVTSDMTINKIKINVIKHFYSDSASRNPTNYRLVHSSKFKWLTDDSSVTDEKINVNDELMLIKVRPASINQNVSEESLKGPSEELILEVTNSLPIRNAPKHVLPSFQCPADFQNEIRKILITLVKASAKILLYSPEAERFCEILKEKLIARCKPNINPGTVRTLTEMGYLERKVLKALRLRKSNMMEALEWLTEHQNDSEDEEDDSDMISIEEECENLGKEENIISIVDRLLESFHRYRKLDFKPSVKGLRSLLEMGFEEKDIIEALKMTGNNQTNACAWLLGERRNSLQNLDKEFDPDNPIYKAIMMDPRIQLSLTNPNMLLVYLSMLEKPVITGERIRDPEIGPILDHIISTYHTEKHATHMNQYVIDC